MSAVETAIEKVKSLDEEQARVLLQWLEGQPQRATPFKKPLGAKAMIGFARRFHKEPRTTESWMRELRAGDK